MCRIQCRLWALSTRGRTARTCPRSQVSNSVSPTGVEHHQQEHRASRIPSVSKSVSPSGVAHPTAPRRTDCPRLPGLDVFSHNVPQNSNRSRAIGSDPKPTTGRCRLRVTTKRVRLIAVWLGGRQASSPSGPFPRNGLRRAIRGTPFPVRAAMPSPIRRGGGRRLATFRARGGC